MARPGFAKNLPKLPPSYEKVRRPQTKLPDPSLQPIERPGEPTSLDLAKEHWERKLRSHLETDLEFSFHEVGMKTTYFQRYVLAYKAVGIAPLSMMYCNFCWNRWPLVGVFAMDRFTLVRFLRGQCCPSCDLDPKRFDINSTLHRIGPSKYFIEQAQRLGMKTERFPYLRPEDEPRFAVIWAQGAPNRGYAQQLWDAIRPLVPNPISEL